MAGDRGIDITRFTLTAALSSEDLDLVESILLPHPKIEHLEVHAGANIPALPTALSRSGFTPSDEREIYVRLRA